MSFTPHEYYLETNGKSIDKDGAYGAQCWDLWAHFTDKCGYPRFNCTQSGYVKDIANLKHQSGLLNYFDEVALGNQQDGDWFVWDFGNVSHIAMFRLDNGNGTGVFLGQNQGVPYVNQVNYSYAQTIGIFRPKIWKELFPKTVTPVAPSFPVNQEVLNGIPADWKAEEGTFTVTVNRNLPILEAPSVNGKDTGLYYEPSESVNYDGYVNRDGFIWISWVSASSGTRRWLAVREMPSMNAYGNFV